MTTNSVLSSFCIILFASEEGFNVPCTIDLDKITCADFYWHLIETKKHKPNNINKFCEVFQDFEIVNKKSRHRIFKLPFVVLRQIKIQTFQYKVLHRVIPCNKLLYNIKIKDSEICEYCNEVDDIVHFFLKCSKVRNVWNVILNWLERLSEIKSHKHPNIK